MCSGSRYTRLVMLELLQHPTTELPCTLEESELCTCLGDDRVTAAPHSGIDICAPGNVCVLGDDGAAAVSHTGADICTREAVCMLGNDRADACTQGADVHTW